jgi:hyperosmotically inducible periplasmic protein
MFVFRCVRQMLFSGSALSIAAVTALGFAAGEDRITREVRHELVTLPYYGVFDNLAYRVDNGGVVTLFGEVTRPTLKDDAEKAVKSIEGVARVANEIEVLPPSPMDDQIRRAVYRAVYGSPSLERYALQAVPSIHIIVKNGHVTLEGAVANKGDADAALIRTKTVPGVFSVDSHLRIDS